MNKLSKIVINDNKEIDWECVSRKRMKYFKNNKINIKIRCPRYRSLNFSIQTFWVWYVFRRSTVLCRCPKMLSTLSCWFKIIICPNLIKIWTALITSCPILINIWAALFGFSTQIPFGLKAPFAAFQLGLFYFFKWSTSWLNLSLQDLASFYHPFYSRSELYRKRPLASFSFKILLYRKDLFQH